MGDLVSRTRQRPTTSEIDHWLVRENFRHLTPSGTCLVLALTFTKGCRFTVARILEIGKRIFVE
jgi:hypothetical protein